MPDMNLSQASSDDLLGREATQPGNLQVSEAENETTLPNINAVSTGAQPSFTAQTTDRTGTVEHLAARRTAQPIDPNSPSIKQQLSELRIEVTRLLTGVRWNGLSVEDAAHQMVPLLNVGSVQQWQSVLIPFLLEIDRAGNLIPVWLYIIEHVEDPPVPSNANPAETLEGRARRFAILMLGNYKYPRPDASTDKPSSFSLHAPSKTHIVTATTLTNTLGELAIDPNTSLYAVQSLVKLSTNEAIETLLTALKDAEGWAKVDVIDGILTINQKRFYDIVLASGLDKVPGLENYIAIPLYRKLPLEHYLRPHGDVDTRLTQQAALVFAQVLHTSTPPTTSSQSLPVAFERDLPLLATALFEGARLKPMWQNVTALHRFGLFLGRYWSEVARGTQQDPRIVHPIQACAPMMPEVERWMAGPGRDTLLDSLTHAEDTSSLSAVTRVLGELREQRAAPALLSYLESVRMLTGRTQALALEAVCDTLVALGEQRAVAPMQAMLHRLIDAPRRASHPKRRENLPLADGDVPGSIIYAAAVRSLGKLGSQGDTTVSSTLQTASRDFDPYVRAQVLTALKQLDPQGEGALSRAISRDLLTDPNDNVARAACQLSGQYHDYEATTTLQRLIETRPALSSAAYEALRQIGQ
jgi:hypothetical protein